MSITLEASESIAQDPNFQARCLQAFTTVCINVVGEGDGITNHTARCTYAESMISPNNLPNGLRIAQIVLSSSNIQQEADITQSNNPTAGGYMIPDSDIITAISNDFNAIAGIIS